MSADHSPTAGAPTRFGPVHHIGITVADLEGSIRFWERLLGTPSRNRRVLDGPQIGIMVGYPGIRIDSCWLDLPGGVALELLQYLDRGDDRYDPGTAHPGNVHLCLHVDDMEVMHAHAVACGARPVSPAPIVVKVGPRAGTRLAYLRDPEGVTIELVQSPKPKETPGDAGRESEALTVPDLLRQRVAEHPDSVALVVDGGDRLTYGQWDRRSNALARGLVERGVTPGVPVLLLFDNAHWLDYAISYLGVHKAGAVAVPLGTRFSAAEIAQVIVHCEARGIVRADGLGGEYGPLWCATAPDLQGNHSTAPFQADVRPADLAEILYTSGTTGEPKGVAISHESVLFHDPPPEAEPSADSRASFVHAFPVGTNAGQEVLRLPLRRADRTAVALPIFDPERFCAVVAGLRVRRLQLVPAMGQMIVNSGAAARHDVSSVERVVLSSAPAPPSLLGGLVRAFPNAAIWNTYALTEAGTARTLMIDAPSRPDSVGRPLGRTEVSIVDEAGLGVETGGTGEVWIRRPGAPARTYYRDPDATAAVFTAGGWVHTGDLGYLDADGYLYLVDRKKDLVIVGGLNVSSIEVESVLFEHPAVTDAAVFGIPHPVLGQDVAAAVVAASPIGTAELQAFVRSRLGEHKVPHKLVFVDELPRNQSGKVRKVELRERFARDPQPAPHVAASDTVGATIVAIWETVLGRSGISMDDDFFDLGGHSLAGAQIVARIGDELGATIPLVAIFEASTPAALASVVRRSRSGETPRAPA